jgi:hypothetical protein
MGLKKNENVKWSQEQDLYNLSWYSENEYYESF